MKRESTTTDPFEFILSMLHKRRRAGIGYVALCPAHDDKEPTLSVARGRDDKVLLNCHAGCSLQAICDALGLAVSDLFVSNGKSRNRDWDVVATYPYHDDSGNVICEHVRYRNKVFHWRRPDGEGNWVYGLFGAWFDQWNDGNWRSVKDSKGNVCNDQDKRPHADARFFFTFLDNRLYSESNVRDALPGSLVPFCEGEKDVHTATKLGFVSTTAGSASDWKPKFAPLFKDLNLVIIPDFDDAGERMAGKVAADYHEGAESVRVLRLPDLPDHGDLTDWYEARVKEGLSDEQARDLLLSLIDDTPLWEPELEGDEFTDKAIKEAQRGIDRVAQMKSEKSDAPLTEDKLKEKRLRYTGLDAARVIDMIMLLMAALGR